MASGLIRCLDELPLAGVSVPPPAQLGALLRLIPAFSRLRALRGAQVELPACEPAELRVLAFSALRELLQSALRDLRAGQGDHAEWCARYRLAQLQRSAEGLASARAWFEARGVRNPERWIALSVPGAEGWI